MKKKSIIDYPHSRDHVHSLTKKVLYESDKENPEKSSFNPSIHYREPFKKRPVFSYVVPAHLVKTYTKCLTLAESVDLADYLKDYLNFGEKIELIDIFDHMAGLPDRHQHCDLLFRLSDSRTRQSFYFVVSHDFCDVVFPLMKLGSASAIFRALSKEACSPHLIVYNPKFEDDDEEPLPF